MSRLVALHPDDLTELLALAERSDTSRALAYLDGDDPEAGEAVAASASVTAGVATITISGAIFGCDCLAMMLGGTTWSSILGSLQAAEADPSVTGVLLDIDSPGGEVTGMQEVGHYIRSMSKLTVAYYRGRGCSAAKYMGRACKFVWAARTAQVGCVGVAMMVGHSDDGGRQIVSSLTPRKNAGLDTAEGLASAQRAVDDLAAEMLGDMAAWSGLPTAAAAAAFYHHGDTISATRAHGLGWLDGLSVSPPLHLFNPAGGPPAHTGGAPVDDEIEAEGDALAEEGVEAEEAEMSPEEKAARIKQLEDELRMLKGEPAPEPEAAPGPAALAFADRLVADKAINPAGRAKAARDYQRDPVKAMREAPAAGAAYRDPTGSAVKPKAVPAAKTQAEAVAAVQTLAAAEFRGDYQRAREAYIKRNPNAAAFFGGRE